MIKKLKLWGPVLIWAGVIFSFSSLKINHEAEFSWLDFIIKKTAHVVEYAILYWLLFRAWTQKWQNISKNIWWKVLIMVVIYALSDEWHQTLVLGREGTLRDVGFDSLGALISMYQIKQNV